MTYVKLDVAFFPAHVPHVPDVLDLFPGADRCAFTHYNPGWSFFFVFVFFLVFFCFFKSVGDYKSSYQGQGKKKIEALVCWHCFSWRN